MMKTGYERRRRSRPETPGGDTDPIRFELFGTRRLEEHAASLAVAQTLDLDRRAGHKLLPRVRENARILVEVYTAISHSSAEQRAITPAAEWLLDNFHIIEEQVHDIGVHLPERYYRGLPKLASGFLSGYPRVYGIAWALVAHTDSRFDPELLALFLRAYQGVQPLTLGELWAIPVTLRIVLLENLRRLAVLIRNAQAGRGLADVFVDALEHAVGQSEESSPLSALGTMPTPILRQSYAVQIAQRLHDPHPGAAPSLDFLNAWLAEEGVTLDEVVHREHADQVAANTTVRNIITSMRAISAFDWREFVEQVSLVDQCLRARGGYADMDFLTRDRYRHAIEDLARRSPEEELTVAQRLMRKIATLADANPTAPPLDPGYFLIGEGRGAFEQEVGFRPPPPQRLLRRVMAAVRMAYPGGILLLTAGILVALPLGTGLGWGASLLIGLCAFFPASDIATDLVNRLVVAFLPPRHLPRLELKSGIPASLRTCVVVPTLFVDAAGVARQVEQMEVRYLANPEGEVTFALLSDWSDADQETLPTDAPLLDLARAGVAALNAKYGGARFFVCHRRRQWNPGERKWMGWERKRGKLHEFNRLLRGAIDTSFLAQADQEAPAAPAGVQYVLTLDADTRLPIGVVTQLVGTAAHPLNRPVFDPIAGRVVAGYGILQPRVTPTLPLRRECSLFHRLFSGACGTDAYSSQVSEVYQDLFAQGTFSGKGLYEVDIFEAALAGRVPENTQLSHDLFESEFARCGLVTDIEFFEEFPYHTAVVDSRAHRWTRGDWQLLPWILGLRREGPGRNLTSLGRWKMLDNLRRSLSAPGAFCTLVAAWAIPGAPQGLLVGFVLLALGMPAWMALGNGLVLPGGGAPFATHLRLTVRNLLMGLGHALVALTLLAHQAWLMVHAIGTTLGRLLLTRRHLLKWVTALQAKTASGQALKTLIRPLTSATGVILAATVVVSIGNPASLPSAAPFLLLWWLAPLASRALSRTSRPPACEALTPAETAQLRELGRRTWRFFTTFVTARDHYLPPDNFQEDPQPVIAHRSSPTNFGLYLLSVLAARDFGWLGLYDAVARLEATLGTLTRLPRLHGHFFNWYDTRDLHPLEPRYLSTVDSGNLAGHLLTLAEGCREAARQHLPAAVAWAGLADTHRILTAALAATRERRTLIVTREELWDTAAALGARLAGPPLSGADWQRLTRDAETLADLARAYAAELADLEGDPSLDLAARDWAELLRDDIASHARDRAAGLRETCPTGDTIPLALAQRLEVLAGTAERLCEEMDFGFLYDPERQLFVLGYRVAEGLVDDSYYDLLASEARLTSLVAIAKRDVNSSHWFHLGRQMTRAARDTVLLSWSGSMFEYLMPSLVSFTPRYSLVDQTCRGVVRRQISYGRERGVPWGISESAFNQRDLEFTYQYSAFGVPGLGLKRGLAEDLVIAPYATALAAMYLPQAAARNFAHLVRAGALGRYGLYEALDYTPERLAEGQPVAIVRCYMAHHQGMSLVALDNVIHDGVMRHRFHGIPRIQATDLLLQERNPRGADTRGPRVIKVHTAAQVMVVAPVRRLPSPTSAVPSTQLLSNGHYAVMVTAAGAGYSTWEGLAVTRWREDRTRDDRGSFLYLRDSASGRVWSAGYQPTRAVPDCYAAVFREDRVRLTRTDGAIASELEILVSPGNDAEIRHLCLTNQGPQTVGIELTSYAEIVLAPPRADLAHPAFSNLFVQTEFLPQFHGLLARRRTRGATDPQVWAAHLLSRFDTLNGLQYETDRARFIGRGQTTRAPVAVMAGGPLSNTVGAVIDPIFSLRTRVRIPPGGTAQVTFTTLAAGSREALLALADQYHYPATFERVSALAWTQAQVRLHHLRISPDEAQLFQALANHLLYANPLPRPSSRVMQLNQGNVTGLWRHGISGDRPILLLRVSEPEERGLVDQLLRAHEYWRLKGLAVDLVIFNAKTLSYAQDLHDLLEGLVRDWQSCHAHPGTPGQGAIQVLSAGRLSEADQLLLSTAARVVLATRRGSLAEQLQRFRLPDPGFATRPVTLPALASSAPASPVLAIPPLEFFNGLGGFADDGREYVIVLDKGQWTPAPWINVIANPYFGFMVSESGGGCTWSLNSHENQLTPWSNDPVSDPPGEVIYLQDLDTGEVWTPTALPIRIDHATYIARHGQGYSRFEHVSHGIHSDLLQLVAPEDPVKVFWLTLRNDDNRPRRLRVVAYVEWVLGSNRSVTAPYVVTEIDAETGALFAVNPWSQDFAGRIGFADLGGRQTGWTGDRGDFIGRNGDLAAPAALFRVPRLPNRTGAGLDPCAALETTLELRPGQAVELCFLLGQGDSRAQASALVRRYRSASIAALLKAVMAGWDLVLGKVQARTPDRGLDLLLNRWLPYQILSCRVWARAAFYQAGGAYGFRDQLQDVMALTVTRPDITRAQILLAAGRQFVAGDVQHWWHPPSGRGVRTHISDDRVWLPYVVAHYLGVTGDTAVLAAVIPFLDGLAVAPGMDDAFYEPARSDQEASLYEHCARALDLSLEVGVHGLPLIGGGDWNDGMNRVGHQGRGESVWLAWFLIRTLIDFAPLAAAQGDAGRASCWLAHAAALKVAVEGEGWDGSWYRRAYFDDGSPLGSAINSECRIDSIAQSWALISGAGDLERARRAMHSVHEYLIRHGDDLVLLFTPPFDQTPLDPGYIKGYLPGVRENGGQYTHAAIWTLMAYALLGQGNQATELLRILNPIHRTTSRTGAYAYKVEPYVLSADIYAEPPHARRGGWTWYTGAAGWFYRAGLESILGLTVRNRRLHFAPCIASAWRHYGLTYRHGEGRYEIQVENPEGVEQGVISIDLDGESQSIGAGILLVDDGQVHRVRVKLGPIDPD